MIYNFDEPIDRRGTDSIKYDQVAREYGDPSIIGMRIADTDFAPPPTFLEALKKRLTHRVMGYTEPSPQLLTNLSDFYQTRTNWGIDPSFIHFSPGILPIVRLNIPIHSQEGDQIAVFTPGYPPLSRSAAFNKRELLSIELAYDQETGQYNIDWDLFERSLTPRTKMFLLCNPHNPLGRVWSRSELTRIAEICLARNIVVISDEIHAFLNFPEHPYTPMASLSKEIAHNTISCFSPGKLFDVPGLVYAFSVISNPAWRKLYAEALESSGNVYTARNVIGLLALESCYDAQNHEWVNQKIAYIQNNARMVDEYLAANLSGILPTPSEGTFLKWLNFKSYGLEDKELERKLIQEAHVVLYPGNDFGLGAAGFCRMNIGCTQLTLKTALGQIYKAFSR